MRRLLAVLLACGMLPLWGCLPAVQPENRAIVQAAGVDAAEDGWQITLQLFDPETADREGQNQGGPTLATAEGATLSEAFALLEAQKGKEIFLGSCRLLVLGPQVPPRPVLEYFNSRPQSRPTMMVAAAQTTARQLLKSGGTGYDTARRAEALLLLAEQERRLPPCRMLQLLEALETRGQDGVLPLLAAAAEEQTGPLPAGSLVLQGEVPALVLSPKETMLLGMTQGGPCSITLAVGDAAVTLERLKVRFSFPDKAAPAVVELEAKGRVSEQTAETAQQTASIAQAAEAELEARFAQLAEKLSEAGCAPFCLCRQRLPYGSVPLLPTVKVTCRLYAP